MESEETEIRPKQNAFIRIQPRIRQDSHGWGGRREEEARRAEIDGSQASPRFRSKTSCNRRGESTRTVFPLTMSNFCSRSLARVREKVSLTVPSSAASTRLVMVNLIWTGLTLAGSGQRFINQLAR